MKLTPHSQKLADEWLSEGGELSELAEIMGVSRGGIGAEISGHCYRPIKDEDFSPFAIETYIDDDRRMRELVAGSPPTQDEMEVWRQAQRDMQEATRFFVWRVPFSREDLFVITIHRKDGYIDTIDGPFYSEDAALPFGEIVYDWWLAQVSSW